MNGDIVNIYFRTGGFFGYDSFDIAVNRDGTSEWVHESVSGNSVLPNNAKYSKAETKQFLKAFEQSGVFTWKRNYQPDYTPKTKAGERTIPMTDEVKAAFIMEREYQYEAQIQSVGRVDGYDDFIFVNKDGNVQNQGALNKALKRIIRDCNCEVLERDGVDSNPVLLPNFSCHHLRHTFATRLCESGINLKVIQDVLGHADVSTTMNIYVDVTNDLKKKELNSFSEYLNNRMA